MPLICVSPTPPVLIRRPPVDTERPARLKVCILTAFSSEWAYRAEVDTTKGGWPERLFVVSKQGRIVYAGDMGPFGFNPSIAYPGFSGRSSPCVSLERFLDAYLARERDPAG